MRSIWIFLCVPVCIGVRICVCVCVSVPVVLCSCDISCISVRLLVFCYPDVRTFVCSFLYSWDPSMYGYIQHLLTFSSPSLCMCVCVFVSFATLVFCFCSFHHKFLLPGPFESIMMLMMKILHVGTVCSKTFLLCMYSRLKSFTVC